MSDIGKLRRSGLISTFGPGAIVDFRDGDAPVSGVVAGLEEWDRNFGPAGMAHPQSTIEPRLIQKLQSRGMNIAGFRLPPVLPDKDIAQTRDRLVAVEFPRWHQCPKCDRIGPSKVWKQNIGRPARYCPVCSDGRDEPVVPVRFVMACERGHIEDFPWNRWVAHRESCKSTKGFLFLKSVGAGLSGLRLSCPDCGAEKSMEGIFSGKTWETMRQKCSGSRPWLAAPNEKGCDETPRAVQRGATNLYFPVTESSIDIPPWSDQLQAQLGQFWAPIVGVADPAQRAAFIRTLAPTLKPALDALRLSVDALISEIEARIHQLGKLSGEDLRSEEYRQFTLGTDTPGDTAHQFEIRNEIPPKNIRPWVRKVVRAVRLREVRALMGFTRINPPGEDQSKLAKISSTDPNWLPAIEVFGEGVFIDLDPARLTSWERQPAAKQRAAEISTLWSKEYEERYGEKPVFMPSARFLLVHTLAHALMRQLTLDCGYSTASLRERLYVDEKGMAGLLIYTSTTDADGTLGGLQRQGLPERIGNTFPAAIHSMEWCSSDPLCISGQMSAPEAASGAACHACVLSPETACEHFNRLLDRAMLVGTPDQPDLGYFAGLGVGGK